jgi:uncharacterized protein (UPF0264 family)
MTRLLVSVRSAAEAAAALEGGADLIDVKEPSRGPLGKADDRTIADVVRVVAGRRPVSAALGELRDGAAPPAGLPALCYVKCGLADCAADGSPPLPPRMWALAEAVWRVNPLCKVAVVAYADWRRARAPSPDAVCAVAVRLRLGALLFDTWEKDDSTLLDWLPPPALRPLIDVCRAGGLRVALAGSLRAEEMRALLPLQPDWFAVRGAVCHGRQRTAAVDAGKVRGLVELLTDATAGS